MFKRNMVLLGLAALLTIAFAHGAAAIEELCVPLGEMTLEPPVEASKTPVDFPHSLHFEFTCKRCHHTWDGSADFYNCTTSGCHDLDSPPTPEKVAADPKISLRYFKTAYHQLCIGCHNEIRIENQELEKKLSPKIAPTRKVGPTGCTECHPR